MAAREFGKLVAERMDELGISQRRLAARLGELPDGSLFDSTTVRTIRDGQRRLTHMLVERLIEVLDLDPDEAWATAGLLPPDVSADELRHLRRLRIVGGGDAAMRQLSPAPATVASPGRPTTGAATTPGTTRRGVRKSYFRTFPAERAAA